MKIRIIILVTPPIHYIVFLLHPISNKKIPSPEKDSRALAVLFTLCEGSFDDFSLPYQGEWGKIEKDDIFLIKNR